MGRRGLLVHLAEDRDKRGGHSGPSGSVKCGGHSGPLGSVKCGGHSGPSGSVKCGGHSGPSGSVKCGKQLDKLKAISSKRRAVLHGGGSLVDWLVS
jgi:hypothetical protein